MRFASVCCAAVLFAACSQDAPTETKTPTLRVDATDLKFGGATRGSKVTRTVHLSSVGTAPVTVSAATIANDARHAFSAGALPAPIAPGAGADLEVVYTAPADASGEDKATLVIESNDPATPKREVALFGTSILDCGFGEADCGGVCTNITRSTANCGECGRACDAGKFCVNGACVVNDCKPKSCADVGKECGAWPDGCGGLTNCAACPSSKPVCDATGKCICKPKSCSELGKQCGLWPDGCGGQTTCSLCNNASQVCDASTGQCCTRKSCADLGKQCGTYPDGCGATVTCNGCAAGTQVCDATSGQCCTKRTCADYPGGCGTLSDGCGGTILCGCPGAQLCNTAAKTCCTKRSCADYPGACGSLSDGCGGTVTCSCGAGQTCDAVSQACCTKLTCANYPGSCGTLTDGCGGTVTCGCPSPTTQTCLVSNACCTKKTCADLPGGCGALPDGCGGTVSCTCGAGQACVTATNTCCTKKTCADFPGACGTLSDGCGGTLTCSCPTTAQTCVAGTNTCCTKKTCAADYPGGCGTLPDGCGGTLTCTCPNTTTQACLTATNSCCTKKTCADYPDACGALSDGCGGTLTCGCSNGRICDATQTCVCATTCAQLGKDCGVVSAGCGQAMDCGACPAGKVCGGGGTPNVCACVPTTCAAARRNCGTMSDGCGNTLTCGSCTSPAFCGASGTCGKAENLALYANYYGGTFTIDVDQNLPNLVIGVVAYERVNVTLTGTYVGNVIGVHIAGFNASTSTVAGQPAGAFVKLDNIVAATLTDSRGYWAMICQTETGATYAGGGCNTREQVVDFFLQKDGGAIAKYDCQGNAFTGTVKVSTPSTCVCKPFPSCSPFKVNCGSIADGCGGTLNCGTCSGGQSCGGGGLPNVCGGCGVGKLFTGVHQPGSVVDDPYVGTRAWDRPYQAMTSDGSYSSPPNGLLPNETSHYLKATGFGFQVPANATVTGLELQVKRKSYWGSSVYDAGVRVVKGGAASTFVDKSLASLWGSAWSVAQYGGPTDLWGEALTPADVNSPNFGAALAATYAGATGNDTPYVDSLLMLLCYTTP